MTRAPKERRKMLIRLAPIMMAAIVLLVSGYNYAMGSDIPPAYGTGAPHVAGAFAIRGGDFHVAPLSSTEVSECQWVSGASCSTDLTAGNWYYGFSLVLSKDVQATQEFTVTVGWDQGAGLAQMGSQHFTVPGGAKAGQSMYFRIGTGTNSISDQLAIEVVVS